MKKFLAALIIGAEIFVVTPANASPVEISPNIFVDEVQMEDWFMNGKPDIIFAGYGSPLFPNKKTHYLEYNSIKYGNLKDGRFIITCNFYGMYEFAIFYKGDLTDDSRRARFIIRDTVDKNISSFEIDSVLAEFNGQYLDPFPSVEKNPIPYRVAEMLYYIVKGEKFYGSFDPAQFVDDANPKKILNPYTQDLYDRCKVNR